MPDVDDRPVVLVTNDIPLGRTKISWYADLVDWERGYPLAVIDAKSLWIDRHASVGVARQAAGLFMGVLRDDSTADLSGIATHRIVGGLAEPIPGRAA